MARRGVVALAFVVVALSVLSGTAAAAPAGDRATSERTTNATQTVTLGIAQELRLTPARPGEVSVALSFDTPANLVELEARLPDDATVTATDGLSRGDGVYVWDGETAAPSLTYRLPVNETRERTDPRSDGQYIFADPGPWAIVRVPSVGASWTWRGGERVTASRTTTVAGEGVAGDAMAYLGPHTERRRTANGQTFRLIVPDRADLRPAPADVFDSVADASERLRAGTPDDEVLLIAAPTSVDWAVFGLQTGPADLWVRASERVDSPNNVWVHEFVHTRQEFDRTPATRWFTEASASYYAALFTFQQGRIDFDTFADRLRAGTDGSAVLSDPSTWTEETPYRQGALVAGDLDRRIRLADEGGTLQSVFRALNAREDVTAAEFVTVVADVADESTAAATERYTTTTETPPMWSRRAHERAFDTAIARIVYAFPAATNASAQRVTGPYRDTTVGGDPVVLAPGERLAVTATVTNDGSATGRYDAPLRVSGVTVERYSGTLEPSERVTVPVSHTFGSPGNYTLSLGTARRAVAVREPVAPAVVALEVTADDAADGPLVVTATVRNGGPGVAAGNVTLTRNGTAVATEPVVLAPGERGQLTFRRPVEGPGTYRFAVGNRTATVTVRGGGAADGPLPATGDGFGVVATLVALAAVLLLAVRVRG